MVREFYANFPRDAADWVIIRVVRVGFDSQSINNLFQLPNDDDGYEAYLFSFEEHDWEELLLRVYEPKTSWDKLAQGALIVNRASLLPQAKV